MKDVLIIKNISREGPGLLEGLLTLHSLSYDIVDLHKNEALPAFDHKALVVLGGPPSANDQTVKMITELEYVRKALAAGAAYLGVCLGLQVAVKALGGQVTKSPIKEVGFLDPNGENFAVELNAEGQQDPLLQGLGIHLKVFQLHGEMVELTPSMTLLGEGKYCKNQIVKLGERAYGIQSHIETTSEMLQVWAAEDPDLVPIGAATLMEQFHAIESEYTQTGKTILTNFLRVADLL
jgi:GMP synthase (glutamine-hydrolysing)